LKKLIKDENPDVVFCYTVKPIIYGAITAWKCGVKKIIPMLTGIGFVYNSSSFKARLLRVPVSHMYKKALACGERVIFQNPDDMEYFCSMGLVSKEKCVLVNGSGVNMERFPKTPLPEKTVFFMLARLMY
jgi:hypothetical protein